MPSAGRTGEGGDPRTPMAWQHRDLNYHQSGYQDRYGPGAEGGRPSSTSDRLSHRTDRSWQQQPPSTSYSQGGQHYPPSNSKDYPPSNRDYPPSSSRDDAPPRDYPHSRDMSPSEQFSPPPHHQQQHHQQQYQSRPQDSRHSATATSTISSSSSEEDSEQPVGPPGPMMGPQPEYGYAGYYPGYPPSQMGGPAYAPSMGYPHGTMKSAKSVPALLAETYDGAPCPVHHGPPMPHGPPMSMPPLMHPGYATMGPPRRAASIYDMRMMASPPPPPTIYGTLPHPMPPPPQADTRSMVGSTMMGPAAPGAPLGIPPQLLPPMARPRPLVIGEGGTAEVLPVRGSHDKGATLPKSVLASKAAAVAAASSENEKIKKPFCWRGGACVGWTILAIVVGGILVTLMLLFIL